MDAGKAVQALERSVLDAVNTSGLHPVVVPVHAATRKIGEANLVMAKTRPKYVGGPRAKYPDVH